MVGRDQHERRVQHGRGGEALVRDEVADLALPKHLSGEVERGGVHRAGVEEVDEQSLAVAGHSGGGSGGIAVFSGLGVGGVDFGLPE